MLFGVLRMPFETAMPDDFSRRQFYLRAQSALDRMERAESQLASLRAELAKVRLAPIERSDGLVSGRDYIPLPGGWELQTKGSGSTFRIVDTKSGDRLAIPEYPYLHETLERMAREIHAAAKAIDADRDAARVELEKLERQVRNEFTGRIQELESFLQDHRELLEEREKELAKVVADSTAAMNALSAQSVGLVDENATLRAELEAERRRIAEANLSRFIMRKENEDNEEKGDA